MSKEKDPGRTVIHSVKVKHTDMSFSPVESRPEVLLMQVATDGILEEGRIGLVPRALVERLHAEGENLMDFYQASRDRVSLPPNAVFWLVPKTALRDPEGHESCLEDHIPDMGEKLGDPEWTPVYKSGWDGQIWDVEGRPVLVPVEVELWGSRFDLEEVQKHLNELRHPAVRSFEIVVNECRQNWPISGRNHGQLILDPPWLPFEFGDPLAGIRSEKPVATRGWLERMINGVLDHGPDLDPLGISQFRRER